MRKSLSFSVICIGLQVRDELEQLLDDDDDMEDLYLTRKLAGAHSSPISGHGIPNWFPASPTLCSKMSRTSRTSGVTVQSENDIEELEMLLEVTSWP